MAAEESPFQWSRPRSRRRPLKAVEAIQKEFGGGYVAKYQFPGRIQRVGIEYLRSESDYESDTGEQHARWMIGLSSVQDAWVRNVTARFFEQGTVVVRGGSKT